MVELVYLFDEKTENIWKIGKLNAAINGFDINADRKVTFSSIGDNSHIQGKNVSISEWVSQTSKTPAVNFV